MSFHNVIRNLDHEVVGDDVFPIDSGRAYCRSNGLYADKIHTFPIDENFRCLGQKIQPTGGLYLGTGGLLNLKYLSQAKASHGILFDINPFQTIFWNVVIGSIRNNESYDAFKLSLNYSEIFTRKIIQRKLQRQSFSSAGSYTEKFDCNLNVSLLRRGFSHHSFCISSCLSDVNFHEDDYKHIRKMACDKKLSTLTLDMFDEASWVQLFKVLEAHHEENKDTPSIPNFVYVSSIFNFLHTQKDWTGKSLENISAPSFVMGDRTVILDNRTLYEPEEFLNHVLREKEKCQKLQPNHQVSVPAYGKGKLGLVFD